MLLVHPDEERLKKMMKEMTDEDWEKIEENYNPLIWTLPAATAEVQAV